MNTNVKIMRLDDSERRHGRPTREDDQDVVTYRTTRGYVSDDELRAAFVYTLRPEVSAEKFQMALRLFAEMESNYR